MIFILSNQKSNDFSLKEDSKKIIYKLACQIEPVEI
jgi:hypothetical protein